MCCQLIETTLCISCYLWEVSINRFYLDLQSTYTVTCKIMYSRQCHRHLGASAQDSIDISTYVTMFFVWHLCNEGTGIHDAKQTQRTETVASSYWYLATWGAWRSLCVSLFVGTHQFFNLFKPILGYFPTVSLVCDIENISTQEILVSL